MTTLSRLCREPFWRDPKCFQRLWWHPPQRVNPSNCRHHGWTPGQEILPYLRHDMDKSQVKDKDPNFHSHRLPVVFLPCRFKGPGMEHTTGQGWSMKSSVHFQRLHYQKFFFLLMGASSPYLRTTMGRCLEPPPGAPPPFHQQPLWISLVLVLPLARSCKTWPRQTTNSTDVKARNSWVHLPPLPATKPLKPVSASVR